MKIYKYNAKTLEYDKIPWIRKYLIFTTMLIVLFFSLKSAEKIYHYTVTAENILLVESTDSFTQDKLIKEMSELNLRFPHIALAQSIEETGHFTSRIFRENNNLFGQKEAKVRINLAKGTQYGHAYYDSWRDSVLDFAFWLATYASKCKTEEQMFQLLGKVYAENPNYVRNLKKHIKKGKLKEKFK